MAEDEAGILQEYYKKELREKLDRFNEKIKKLFEDLTMKREESKGKLSSLNEELVYYEKELNLKTLTMDSITSLEETTEKQSNDDDHLLVYTTLKNRLIEISKDLLQVENIQSTKIIYNDEPIQFQCVCVLFVPDLLSPNDICYQTFRINHDTKAYNIIESGLALWEQREKEDSAKLFFYESDDSWKFVFRNENVNNMIKNNKSTLKRAKFLLSINNFKPHTDDNTQEKNQNMSLVINKDQSVNNFFHYTRNFIGLANYVQEKYTAIKESENKLEKEEKKPVSYFYLFCMGLNILFIVVFLIFLIISNNEMSNPTKSYVEIELLKSQFNHDQTFGNQTNVIDFIVKRFDPYFFDNTTKINPFKMINSVRFSFYQSISKKCMNSDEVCYEAYYTNNPFYFSDSISIPNDFDNKCPEIVGDPFFLVTGDPILISFQNYLIDNIFRKLSPIQSNISKTNIKGKYGIYNGEECLNIFLSVNYMNNKTLCNILKIINDQNTWYFDKNKQRALVVTFALQNLFTQKYYYVSLIFESSTTIGYLAPIVNVNTFYPNLNEIGSGKLILITDIFRIIFSIYILLFAFYQIYIIYSEYTEKRISLRKLLNKTLTLETVCDIGIFIIAVMAFSAKINNLYLNIETAQSISNNEAISGYLIYHNLPILEYYPIMDNYQYAMMLEAFLMLFVLLRLLTFTVYVPRIRKFFFFMRFAFIKAFSYFVILLLFILIFTIYAHNQWGERIELFASYSSSFYFVFDFSFGLFQYIFNEINSDYEVILIFLFVGIIIFFLQSSLFSVYVECYRLNSLRKGNLYQMRASKRIEYKEKKNIEKGKTLEIK